MTRKGLCFSERKVTRNAPLGTVILPVAFEKIMDHYQWVTTQKQVTPHGSLPKNRSLLQEGTRSFFLYAVLRILRRPLDRGDLSPKRTALAKPVRGNLIL